MSDKITPQIDVWRGDFGRAYTERNQFEDHAAFNRFYSDRFGLSRDELNLRFLDRLPRDIRIVEVGCNIGNQLAALKQLGFQRLYGVELQTDALERARAKPGGYAYGAPRDSQSFWIASRSPTSNPAVHR